MSGIKYEQFEGHMAEVSRVKRRGQILTFVDKGQIPTVVDKGQNHTFVGKMVQSQLHFQS